MNPWVSFRAPLLVVGSGSADHPPARAAGPGPSRLPGHALPGLQRGTGKRPAIALHASSRSGEAAWDRTQRETLLLGPQRLRLLDQRFGAAVLPRVKPGVVPIHDWERDANGVLLHPGLVLVPAAGGRTVHLPDLLDLQKLKDGSTFHMFAVTLVGALAIGEAAEIAGHFNADGTPARWGHPTLTGGAPARIAGELHYDPQAQAFYINNHSGRFNKGHHDRGRTQLAHVAALLRANGLEAGLRLHPRIPA